MIERLDGKTSRISSHINSGAALFVVAAIIYIAFATYLYQPYFKNFDKILYLLVANSFLASLGCYVLSRRWVAGFTESFFAGAIYGFGPFTLGLAKFHPSAGLLVAALPWLFCPAVFGPKTRWKLLRVPLSVLPFVAIVLFFKISAHYHLYPVPIKLKLHTDDLLGLLAPLVSAKRQMTLVGFYHIPMAALTMGFSMLFAPIEMLCMGDIHQKGKYLTGLVTRRFGIIAIFVIGTILAFCDSVFGVSPVIWLAISILCSSILIGAGMQGLICAGFADRKWILFDVIVMGALAIATLLLATESFQIFAGLAEDTAKLFTEAAKIYILGAIVVAVIFFMAHTKLLMRPLRQVVLCAAMTIDIFLGARFVVDIIF